MKAILLMFDSLRRCDLPCYGSSKIKAPNFERLAEKTVKFTNAWVGSMPCMPCRRELHTGRYNFLHRSWGPLEPFDDSMPEILKDNGIYSHLVSDHYHYWEDGGATYHTRYSSWQASRGQEGDPWKADLTDNIDIPETLNVRTPERIRQDFVNRHYISNEKKYPQIKTFDMGCEFMETNHKEQNWFLHIETFDPHEPFYSDPEYKKLYGDDYTGPLFDWPDGGNSENNMKFSKHLQAEYAALVSMCDDQLGRVLDIMDKYKMWDDTMLIVNTDHGLMLGEQDCWMKLCVPWHKEAARIPFFVWDPRCKRTGQENGNLVQNIDIAPTVLGYFGIDKTKDMMGIDLKETIASDCPSRDAILFGHTGGHVNCTDGRYLYMRAPAIKDNKPLFNYTLMPTHMNRRFSVAELKNIELAEPFSFTKGVQTMKIPYDRVDNACEFGTRLYDLNKDVSEIQPENQAEIEDKMISLMTRLMKENDCPQEQWQRLGL